MKALQRILAITLATLLLSACGTYKPMTAQEKMAFTGLSATVEVPSSKAFILTSGLEAMTHARQGDNLDSPVESADEKLQARLVQALAKHGVDIREIIARQWPENLKAHPALLPKNPGTAANTKLSISVNAFGTASGIFSSYGPNLGLQAQLLDAQGKPQWRDYKFVAHSNGDMPHYKLDELIDNPAALRAVFEAAAKYTVNALLDSLEAEFKTLPATVSAPQTATNAPVATKPTSTAGPAPVQLDAFGEPVAPTCNGWCGLPGGFKLGE